MAKQKKVEKRPTKVIGYCRVSTEEQVKEGVSLEAQHAKIVQYASLYNYEVVDVLTDAGFSGKSLDRPALQQALGILRRTEADGLLVAKLDRLTRRVYHLAQLIEEFFADGKVHLLSVNEQLDTHSAAGRLLVHILASVAEWERETIAERVRDALGHLKEKGVKLGRSGLGWDHGEGLDIEGRKVIEDVESEKKTVARIVELRESGLSLRKIAAQLHREGHPTKRGGYWQAQTVAVVLERVR